MRWSLLLLALGALFISAGCNEEEEEIVKHEKQQAKVPVDLPPKPNLDSILKAPRQHPDGSLTVTGLILDKHKHFKTDVQVRGVIRETSPDCPFITDPAEKENRPRPGEKRRVCKAVYATIADSAIAPKELLIVNYDPYFHPYLKEGLEVVVKGHYDIEAGGFVRPRDGLLLVEEVVNLYVDQEGVFTQDPAEVKRLKEEQAALEAEAAAQRMQQ